MSERSSAEDKKGASEPAEPQSLATRGDGRPVAETTAKSPADGGFDWRRSWLPARTRRSGLVIQLPWRIDSVDDTAPEPREVRVSFDLPVLGVLAATFGVIALFQSPIILGPVAVVLGGAAVWRGQTGLGIIGIGAGLAALATSITFWGAVGLGWLWTMLF